MTNLHLQKLYAQLSQLRLREAHGQNVSTEIQKLLAEIAQVENTNRPTGHSSEQPPPHPVPQSSATQFDVNIGGNAVGSAIGPNASVNAEIISGGDVQKIQTTTNRYESYASNPGPYDYHSSHAEVIAGNLVEQTASRVFWRAPRAVAVSILMLSPFFALSTEESMLFGAIGLLTITPLCIYVLWQTRFFNIPEFVYKDRKILVISSWVVTALGVILVIVVAVIYYLIMLFLTAMTGAVREQIGRS